MHAHKFKHMFSPVWLFETLWIVASQSPLPMEFSRQHYWSRLPFPSGLGRSPGGEHGNPLQCSYLENPMDRGAWRATVYRVTRSQIRLQLLSINTPSRGYLWPRIEHVSLASLALAGRFFTTAPPGKPHKFKQFYMNYNELLNFV